MKDMFKVLEPGPLATVQDLGRYGYQQFGVPVSGGLDRFALRTANLLVGNPEGAAVIEMTFMGAKLEVLAPAEAAVTGAEMPVTLNDRPVASWSSFAVEPSDVIAVKPAKSGLRGYLAVTGGIAVPEVMGSRSTYVGGKIGGFKGRNLTRGDVLPRGEAAPSGVSRSLPVELRPAFAKEITLRAVPGPQDDFFDHGLAVFFDSAYTISAKADRMGYRLEGPEVPLKEGAPRSIISEPSLPGAVQIPADGLPIVLLVEQTVGGYAKIATVITPDLDRLAQARPGETVRFERIDLAAAHRAVKEYEAKLDRVRAALK